jgi:hypothetical protein
MDRSETFLDVLLTNRIGLQEKLRTIDSDVPPAVRDRALEQALVLLCRDVKTLSESRVIRAIVILDRGSFGGPGTTEYVKDLKACKQIGDDLDRRVRWPPPPTADALLDLYEEILASDQIRQFRKYELRVAPIVDRLSARICGDATTYYQRRRSGSLDDTVRQDARRAVVRAWLAIQVIGVVVALPGDMDDVWHRLDGPAAGVMHVLLGPGADMLVNPTYPKNADVGRIVRGGRFFRPQPESPARPPEARGGPKAEPVKRPKQDPVPGILPEDVILTEAQKRLDDLVQRIRKNRPRRPPPDPPNISSPRPPRPGI